ncbi:hypothetical protein NPIL_456601 [Nephila pilipes]|uniref:Uncharacterized protein n=1 Tax=Nephila pilipes TaxID=299642 RepID=A0A8X6SZR6_NEPPI|nr:hypothetical protein NPIL_456601 [Nephila pilipes]
MSNGGRTKNNRFDPYAVQLDEISGRLMRNPDRTLKNLDKRNVLHFDDYLKGSLCLGFGATKCLADTPAKWFSSNLFSKGEALSSKKPTSSLSLYLPIRLQRKDLQTSPSAKDIFQDRW